MGSIAKYLTNYHSDKKTFAKEFRKKRIRPFMRMIEKVFREKGSVSILDIGGTRQYWKIVGDDFLSHHNVTITVVNLPEEIQPKEDELFKFVLGDATGDLWSVLDKTAFDLIHSNSVIEHVGDWSKMTRFARNIAEFQGGYFVQTPNFWFPVEPHCMTLFFHWLPKPTRVALVCWRSLGHWRRAKTVSEAVYMVETVRLLSRSMFFALFPDADIVPEKFLFLNKSFVAIRDGVSN